MSAAPAAGRWLKFAHKRRSRGTIVKQIRWHSYCIRISPCASRNPHGSILDLIERGFVKIEVNSTGRILRLACIASWLAIQAWPGPQYSHRDSRQAFEHDRVASDSIGAMSPLLDRVNVSKEKAAEVYGGLPLGFEANYGQADPQVKYLSRVGGCNLYLTAKEAVLNLRGSTRALSYEGKHHSAIANPLSCMLRMKLVGASDAARTTALDELSGKTNYFIGNDPKKWRTNVPTYSSVKFHNVYPGVDVLYYGNRRELEYDFIVAPGASFKPIGMAFEGARRIRLDASGDLVIETPIGEVRQHKPLIYQQASGIKQEISGRYVIRGEGEVGFEVGDYDPSRAVVIDPVLVYSTSIGGLANDSANAVAVDAAGNAYLTGMTTSFDFPTVNPFQRNLGLPAVFVGVATDAFIVKLNPSGTAIVYSTYLGGVSSDVAKAIAVDATGNAYVTGFAASKDFPTTPDAFQTKPSTGGDAFITKLNPTGNALVYSTYLGGSGVGAIFNETVTIARGLAVDTEGSAYVTGYTFSPAFPTKKAAQGQFNRGATINCCFECLYNFAPGISPLEDAFVTKLNPSGTELVYSTYLGGTGQDEAYAIAVDSSGSAYVTGRTCSRDFAGASYGGGASDAFVVKLSPSGRQFLYSGFLGGSGDDAGNGIVVDSAGNAYVTGQTDSVNFPATQSAFQQGLGGGVSYATTDGGGRWNPGTGLPNSPVNVVAIDPANPSTIYAGLGGCSTKAKGVFKSTDGGNSWRSSGLAGWIIQAIAIDPKQSSTVYAGPNKSTDGGATWNQASSFDPIGELTIDPVTPTTLYAISNGIQCGDARVVPSLRKSTDGGGTWNFVRIRVGAFFFVPNSLALDPQNPSTLYATGGDLYESTDGGTSWRVPYEGNRNFVRLAIDPTNSSTLYLSDPSSSIFKSTDRGRTFAMVARIGNSINQLLVDPTNSSTLYAALSSDGQTGGVFKSTDGGQTWNATDLIGMTINTLAIDPLNSLRVYAGSHFDVDGFLAKVNPAGSPLAYSSYLGTRSPDVAASIGVDEPGNAYVTGRTFSDRFPRKDALQSRKPSGPFDAATFTTKMNSTGSAILFSTYAGGSDPSFGSGIAVDPAGKVYLAGATGRLGVSPSGASTESVFSGLDAFVIKIVSPPRITGASVSGKNVIVTGEGFDRGAVILIDGAEQRTRNDESKPATVLIGKKTAKNIPPGQPVSIQVRNSDGLLSESFSFTRPP